MAKRKKSLRILTYFFIVLVGFVGLFTKVLVASERSSPNFPKCEDKIFTSQGDKAHYDFGIHGIPGLGNREGSDDVYSLPSGNFLQCFCPKDGGSGIQSNWWNAKDLSDEERGKYGGQGWMYAPSGEGWGLTNDPYLILNREFSCNEPKVTLCHATGSNTNPFVVISIDESGAFNGHLGEDHQKGEDIIPPFSWQGQTYSQNWDSKGKAVFDNECVVPDEPTITPTPKPTVTSSPVPTPTVLAATSAPSGPISKCYDLEASPEEGVAPLTVRFFAHADDPATGGKIKEYRFDFADASGGQPQVVAQTDPTAYHRYELSGEYEASLKVQDNAGNWRESDDCKVKIKVSSSPQVLSASTAEVLPSTGASSFAVFASLLLLPVGIFLFRRFRLV